MDLVNKFLSFLEIPLERSLINECVKNEKRKIYHYHVRKTGGTSINHSFLSFSGYDNVKNFNRILNNSKHDHRIVANEKVFVAWNRFLLNRGKYFYGYAHHPMHILNIPEDVFTITCFRDPLNRFVSHYNMLRYYQKENVKSIALKNEGKYLGNSVVDFAKNISPEHFKNQIYMFSKKINYIEAAENIINNCDFVLRTEYLDEDLTSLGNILDLNLSSYRERSYGYKEEISQSDKDLLRELLDDEYKMFEILMPEFAKKTDEEIKIIATNKFTN